MAIRLEEDREPPDSFSYLGFVFNCITGVGIAGLLYPVFVATYLLFRAVIPNLFQYGLRINQLGEALFFIFGPLLIASLLGFMAAVFSSWICGLLICAVNASMGYPLRPKIFISCVGGMAGYALLALFFVQPGMFLSFREASEAFIIGPCLGALIGQTGARWWARKRVLFPYDGQYQLPTMQFRIAHVLALTAWLALTLAILRLATNTNLPLLLALYFPVQIACLGVGQLLDRYADWKTGIRYVG